MRYGIVAIITGAWLIFSANLSCAEMKKVKVFYLPFEIETYIPVTKEDIENQTKCVFEIPTSSEDAALLSRLVENGIEGKFSNKVVRLKVVALFNDDVFVDRDGGILRDKGEKNYHLTQETFSQLKILMEKLAKFYGCR